MCLRLVLSCLWCHQYENAFGFLLIYNTHINILSEYQGHSCFMFLKLMCDIRGFLESSFSVCLNCTDQGTPVRSCIYWGLLTKYVYRTTVCTFFFFLSSNLFLLAILYWCLTDIMWCYWVCLRMSECVSYPVFTSYHLLLLHSRIQLG